MAKPDIYTSRQLVERVMKEHNLHDRASNILKVVEACFDNCALVADVVHKTQGDSKKIAVAIRNLKD